MGRFDQWKLLQLRLKSRKILKKIFIFLRQLSLSNDLLEASMSNGFEIKGFQIKALEEQCRRPRRVGVNLKNFETNYLIGSSCCYTK